MARKKKEVTEEVEVKDDVELQIAFDNACNNVSLTPGNKSTFAAITKDGAYHVTVEKIS